LGQKTHPIGLRLGIVKSWESSWFDQKNFAEKLDEDLRLRKYIRNRLNKAAISKIEIERTAKRIILTSIQRVPELLSVKKVLKSINCVKN
jgi:small subunit ribosomal protein S3